MWLLLLANPSLGAEPAPAPAPRPPRPTEWASVAEAVRGIAGCWSRIPVAGGNLGLEVTPDADGTSRTRWWSAVQDEGCTTAAVRHVPLAPEAADLRPVGIEVWISGPLVVAWGSPAPTADGSTRAAARSLFDAWPGCVEGHPSPSRVPIRIDLPAGGGAPTFAALGGSPPEWAWCVVAATPRAELERLGVGAVLFVPPG